MSNSEFVENYGEVNGAGADAGGLQYESSVAGASLSVVNAPITGSLASA